MDAPRLERKLVAILAADVEGYSRHMEQDEVATLATLSRHRLIVDDLIARHSGRIIGTAGDSVLAEFVSVVDAVDCAVQIQQAITAAMADERPERRMLFRIGINVGDVMLKPSLAMASTLPRAWRRWPHPAGFVSRAEFATISATRVT